MPRSRKRRPKAPARIPFGATCRKRAWLIPPPYGARLVVAWRELLANVDVQCVEHKAVWPQVRRKASRSLKR